jgi:pimeloyl-ACP methyl ester carboxylesterase
MEPPEHLRDERYRDCPIVCIPGISNSLAGFETLIKELVYQGRTVIAIAQPESPNADGIVTKDFAAAVESRPNLETHIEFFDQAVRLALKQRMDNVYGDEVSTHNVRFDLLGHSTGCPIIAGLLAKDLFQKATHNTILVSPAGVAEQTILQFDLANIPEVATFIKNRSHLSGYNRDTSTQTEVKARVSEGVKQTIIHPLEELYTGANLANGHQILVLSGDEDRLVKSRQAKDKMLEWNPNIKWVSMTKAAHAEALVNPERVVRLIKQHVEEEEV